ncbi:MAG: hypothetical protein IT374_16840 [Polyangiaceae bacterium]|nr:hypothetical protein [Polyangiaceae bacterium]
MSAAATHTERFLEEIRREFPSFRLIHKRDDRFSRLIDAALRVVTLGGQREYLTRYHTVIAGRLYVPACWDDEDDLDRVIVLRHERVHLRQSRRYGFIGMAAIYLVPIFPLGLAYGRARIEWEAYTESLRATAELRGLDAARHPALRAHIMKQFTSAAYGWMWPFPGQLSRWYDEALAAIEAESSTGRGAAGYDAATP